MANLFGKNDDWADYGPTTPLTPSLRAYGEPKPTQSFFQHLLSALYGEPNSAAPEWRAFNSTRDPATLGRMGLAVLRGFPKGVDDFIVTLTEFLKLHNAASRGYVAALLETPKRYGTVSESNPLIKYLAERGEIEGLLSLRRELRALDNADIWTALKALKQVMLQTLLGSVTAYRKKLLNAKSVDELGDLLGRMWGFVSADTICNVLAWRMMQKAAYQVGRRNVAFAEKMLSQLDLEIEKGYRQSAMYLRMQKRFEDRMRKQAVDLVEGVDFWVTVEQPALSTSKLPAAIEGMQTPKSLTAGKGTGTLAPAKTTELAVLPVGRPSPQIGEGVRHFSLGDLEPTPGVPLLPPRGVVRTELIATRWGLAAMALIRSNIGKLPGLPAWVPSLPDGLIFQIASVIASNHPEGLKISAKDFDQRVLKVAGMIQEIVNPMRPEFGEHFNLIKKLLREEGRWDLDSLEYAPRLFTVEPDARGLPVARRAEATDGLWLVQPKDKSFFLFPWVYESKSKSNTNDLFFERVKVSKASGGGTYSARDPLRAQPFRDVERLSNLDVILEIPQSDGTRIKRIHIPSGMVGISRKTTRFALITPRKAEGLRAMDELVRVGFSRENLIVLPPAYDRRDLETLARRLLNASYDSIFPPEKQQP